MSRNPSTNRKQHGEADLWFGVFLFLLMLVALVFVFTQDMTRAECINFGKTKVFGVLYECKKIEEKK